MRIEKKDRNRRVADWPRLLAAGVACLLVVGCGGGDGDGSAAPPGGGDPVPGYPTLNEAAAEAYAQGAEFQRVEPGGNLGCGADPNCVSAHPYALQNIHYAHTATLANGEKVRGKGMLIAVVDDGFRTTHRELAGKTIRTYLGVTSSMPVEDHGTAVVGLAAGKADGLGMMGVAPEADLHLTSWQVPPGVDLLPHLTGATNDAAARGAVVQNNSWGWTSEIAAGQELSDFEASGDSSYAEYIADRKGGAPADWQNLFDAYDGFQNTGVIVFANSNDQSLGDASAWAALPLFVPELEEAWLVVSNALFTLNADDGTIRSAELLSAPCGSAAEFCVTSDGSAYAPSADSDTSYGVGAGTSFAAPQVSGQIALLAQAFPSLSPAELTTRLLATARQDWQGFQNSIAGQQTFAPGVTRSYSSLYGHGLPDMKAALSPVGGLSVASGDTVATAERTSLDDGIATSGPVVGNAVAKAIAGREVMVIDALGSDFYVSGSELGVNAAARAPGVDAGDMAKNVDRIAAAFAFAEGQETIADRLHDAAVPKLFFSQTLANTQTDTAFSRLFPAGENSYLQFSGSIERVEDKAATAFSVSRLTAREGFATEFSLSFGHSNDGFFGAEARGPFVSAEDTGNMAAGLSVSVAVSESWSMGAYAELGSGFVGEAASALVDYGAFAYAGGGLTARRRAIFTTRDMLDLYAGVRPAAIAGEAEIRLPVGRDGDGTIHYDNIAVDLADADLPMRLGFVYRNRTERDFDFVLGFNTDFVTASDPDPIYSVSLGLAKTF